MMKTTIQSKLALSFAVVLMVMVGLAAVVVGQISAVNQRARQNYSQGLVGVELIGDAIAEALQTKEHFLLLIAATTPEEQLRQDQEMDKHTKNVLASVATYEPLLTTPGAEAALADFRVAWSAYTAAQDEAIQLSEAGQVEQAIIIGRGQAGSQLEQAVDFLQLVQDIEDNLARANFEQSQAIFQRAQIISFAASGLALLLSLGLAIWLARSIATPIAEIAQTAAQVAGGNLEGTIQIDPQRGDEVGVLSRAFSNMTEQLRNLVGSLEARVAARTERLEIGATLAEQLGAVLDVDQLMDKLVHQVQASFGYYHAHVYLLDEQSRNLVMAAGTGEAGRQMKAAGHQIALNAPTSLVARAARSGQIVRVDNVRQSPNWLPNALLPDTYSEMAVPIVLDGKVVGVLDVQEDTISGLDEGDESLLRSLANQVAVGIRNAQLFREVETQLAEARALQARYVTRSWKQVGRTQGQNQTLTQRPNAPTLNEAVIAHLDQKIKQQTQPAIVPLNGSDPLSQTAIIAPVRVQDQTVGAIQLLETEQPRQWTDQEVALVQTIADQIAQTAENLRLFEETRDRASQEQTIREITDRFRASANLEQLVKVATETLAEHLSATHVKLRLGIPPNQTETNGHQSS